MTNGVEAKAFAIKMLWYIIYECVFVLLVAPQSCKWFVLGVFRSHPIDSFEASDNRLLDRVRGLNPLIAFRSLVLRIALTQSEDSQAGGETFELVQDGEESSVLVVGVLAHRVGSVLEVPSRCVVGEHLDPLNICKRFVVR